ncbi:hypothetical protein LK540_14285 [Massilia sp. IC2-278]|uniref:hypothetical protein n=1 Tax=Massilia sp. IC2-278 TaxID=2887200 RepID=UPI001E30F8EE|nr:hypothetical protein [Massilia sp. IC2-278]MCC2961595.1 hypothetical protein [Massilia sp. IC2-278]
MKIFHIIALGLALGTACVAYTAAAKGKALTIGGKTIIIAGPGKCSSVHRPGRELARYLRQYDPTWEAKQDANDETPYTKEDIRLIKNGLVEAGFRYPNTEESVITWMDIDDDGVCDFTASTGVGGMRSIDRMFLFRGLGKGSFQLIDSDHRYMEGSITVVPYIPLTVSGERLPVLVKEYTLLQWQADSKRFATCETIQYGPEAANQRAAFPLLAQLCPKAREIYDWAAGQLPHKNIIPH